MSSINILPDDLLIEIFQQYLLTSMPLYELALICHRWKTIILETSTLWRTIWWNPDLYRSGKRDRYTSSGSVHCSKNGQLYFALEHSGHSPLHISIGARWHEPDCREGNKFIAQNTLPRWKSLRLHTATGLTEWGIPFVGQLSNLEEAILQNDSPSLMKLINDTALKLHTLRLDGSRGVSQYKQAKWWLRLRTLTIYQFQWVDDEKDLAEVISKCRNLVDLQVDTSFLDLRDCIIPSSLRRLRLTQTSTRLYASSFNQLTHLILSGPCGEWNGTYIFPSLTQLTLIGRHAVEHLPRFIVPQVHTIRLVGIEWENKGDPYAWSDRWAGYLDDWDEEARTRDTLSAHILHVHRVPFTVTQLCRLLRVLPNLQALYLKDVLAARSWKLMENLMFRKRKRQQRRLCPDLKTLVIDYHSAQFDPCKVLAGRIQLLHQNRKATSGSGMVFQWRCRQDWVNIE